MIGRNEWEAFGQLVQIVVEPRRFIDEAPRIAFSLVMKDEKKDSGRIEQKSPMEED